jgi:hypothetical protein
MTLFAGPSIADSPASLVELTGVLISLQIPSAGPPLTSELFGRSVYSGIQSDDNQTKLKKGTYNTSHEAAKTKPCKMSGRFHFHTPLRKR